MNGSYYIYNAGKLSRKDNTICFEVTDGEKKSIPIEKVEEIYIMSEMSLNTAFLSFMAQNGVVLHFFNYYQFYTGSFYPREQLLAGKLLVRQVEAYTNTEKRLELAKKIIQAASFNIYRNLRYYNGRGKDVKASMQQIEDYRKQIIKADSIESLMGIEGNIRKAYYSSWNTIIDQNIDFKKRVMHPPDNQINSLISFVNMLIYTKVLTEIYHTQLNPTISYLHEPGVRRFSLSLDIAEIFKPLIGDRLIFSLLNRNQITEKSFRADLNGLQLKKEASQLIVSELDERLGTTIKHKDLGRPVSYQYLIRLECYKLIKHLIGEKEYAGFEMWW
ncbi:MAG: type I-B CRISPR-associated endonuclease Cas1b [Lachnospiraceae bacterium]|nr:type I-B CRISPR-associated endonuclease Cas1b [Lachnospiraceae bacterium]